MRPGVVATLASVSLLALGAAPGAPRAGHSRPERMADTGGGTQLITAQALRRIDVRTVAARRRARSPGGTGGGQWVKAGSAPARFGAKGLVEGGLPQAGHEHDAHRAVRPAVRLRHQGGAARDGGHVPPGAPGLLVVPGHRLPLVQPLDRAAPRRLPGRRVRAPGLVRRRSTRTRSSSASTTSGRCGGAARESSCTSTGVGRRPVVCRCAAEAMRRIVDLGRSREAPHIAIGTAGGRTAITRY